MPIFAGINELLVLKNRKFYQTNRFLILLPIAGFNIQFQDD